MPASTAGWAPRTIRRPCARTARACAALPRRGASSRRIRCTARPPSSSSAAWSTEERPARRCHRHGHAGPRAWRADGRLRACAVRRPEARVVAAAHAGWRGAIGGVLGGDACGHGAAGRERGTHRGGRRPVHRPSRPTRSGSEFEEEFLDRDPRSAQFFVRPQRSGRPPAFRPAGLCRCIACAGRDWPRCESRRALLPRRRISSAIGGRRPERSPITAAKSLPSS